MCETCVLSGILLSFFFVSVRGSECTCGYNTEKLEPEAHVYVFQPGFMLLLVSLGLLTALALM